MGPLRFFGATFLEVDFQIIGYFESRLSDFSLSDATPSPRDGTTLVLSLKPDSTRANPAMGWHEAFEKMHKGEVEKSVLRPL